MLAYVHVGVAMCAHKLRKMQKNTRGKTINRFTEKYAKVEECNIFDWNLAQENIP